MTTTYSTQPADDDGIFIVDLTGAVAPTSRVARDLGAAESLIGLFEEHVADQDLVVMCESAIEQILAVAAVTRHVPPGDRSLGDALRSWQTAVAARRGSHPLLDATLALLSIARWWYRELCRPPVAAASARCALALMTLEKYAEPECAHEPVAAVGDAVPKIQIRTLLAAPAAPPCHHPANNTHAGGDVHD